MLKPLFWKSCGGILFLSGLIWAIADLTGLPLHSSTAVTKYKANIEASVSIGDYAKGVKEADKWIARKPLDWRAYHQRARLSLRDPSLYGTAEADFQRALFVEPKLPVVALKEGIAWVPHDPARTLEAWREAFARAPQYPLILFQEMMDSAGEDQVLLAGLSELSQLDDRCRAYYLSHYSGDSLMQEFKHELEKDGRLTRYDRDQRGAILENWIRQGASKSEAEALLEGNKFNVRYPWWLWSVLRKEKAEFKEAVKYLRDALEAPDLPDVSIDGAPPERLQRAFSLSPGDELKGAAMLSYCIRNRDFQRLLEVTDRIIVSRSDVPAYVLYWHAESFYHLDDYIECWYAYEKYLDQVWERKTQPDLRAGLRLE